MHVRRTEMRHRREAKAFVRRNRLPRDQDSRIMCRTGGKGLVHIDVQRLTSRFKWAGGTFTSVVQICIKLIVLASPYISTPLNRYVKDRKLGNVNLFRPLSCSLTLSLVLHTPRGQTAADLSSS